MHQNEWFQVWFFKNFLGRGSPSPLPRPPPPAFSRASPSVQASPSILGRFAPSTRASPSILGRFAPSIRALPSTFDWGSWFGPPQSEFLDPSVRGWVQKLTFWRYIICARPLTKIHKTQTSVPSSFCNTRSCPGFSRSPEQDSFVILRKIDSLTWKT